ncbi:hypothetical protein SNEBB_011070 [Seison nebaliae]|nr:hypothetical protein SNEBB_011070 [Seison nebaliae]
MFRINRVVTCLLILFLFLTVKHANSLQCIVCSADDCVTQSQTSKACLPNYVCGKTIYNQLITRGCVIKSNCGKSDNSRTYCCDEENCNSSERLHTRKIFVIFFYIFTLFLFQ